jgi:hypothetical protein
VLRRLITTVVIPVAVWFSAVGVLELNVAQLPPRLQPMIREPEALLNTGLGILVGVAALSWLLDH